MSSTTRIYLDNAATSWPKPPGVLDAVLETMRDNGASAGRSSHASSLAASRMVEDARRQVAKLLGAEQPETIVFGFNGTDVLNLAIGGALPEAKHVVTTAAEHNSVLRPLHAWRDATRGRLTIVPCDEAAVVSFDAMRDALADDTDLLVMTHASNVTGAIQPIDEIGAMAKQHGVLSILDAAQTLGHEPVKLADIPFDIVASSGHKGLLGPLGTGVLYVRPGIEERLIATRTGGTGTTSESPHHPRDMPHKFEAGNANVPALAGLKTAAAWIESQGVDQLRDKQHDLLRRLAERLDAVDSVRRYGPCELAAQTSLVSFNITGFDPQEAAALLDSHYGIEVRSGLHCAPLAHRAIGSMDLGGTIRVSLGAFTTDEDIAQLAAAIEELAAAAVEM